MRGLLYLHLEGVMAPGTFAPVDPSAKDSPWGPDFGRVSEQLDPLTALLALSDGYRGVRPLGVTTLDGEPMAGYRLDVDGQAGTRSRGVSLPAGTPRMWVYRVWVDQHQMVRRIKVKVGRMRAQAVFSDWGRRVKVTPPPADALVALPGL